MALRPLYRERDDRFKGVVNRNVERASQALRNLVRDSRIVASWTPCDASVTSSREGHFVAAMRWRRSASASSDPQARLADVAVAYRLREHVFGGRRSARDSRTGAQRESPSPPPSSDVCYLEVNAAFSQRIPLSGGDALVRDDEIEFPQIRQSKERGHSEFRAVDEQNAAIDDLHQRPFRLYDVFLLVVGGAAKHRRCRHEE